LGKKATEEIRKNRKLMFTVLALFFIYIGVDVLFKRGYGFLQALKKFAVILKVLCGLGLIAALVKILKE
jgi:hypothetical protein